MESSRLIRDGVDRERMLDMDRRLTPVRRRSLGVLGLALVASGPWLGWWTLVPLLVAAALFGLADRKIAAMDRPEYALFAAWVGSEVMIVASLALTGGPTAPMMCWTAIPMVTLVARFSDRGIALGFGVTVALLLGVAFGVDAGAVIADPPLVIAPVALIVVVTMFAMTLMRSDAEHRTQALLDPLTAMLNRAALEGRVEELVQQSAITGEPVGMILADIDHFKAVNDRHGHAKGDEVLRDVALAIRGQLRAFDLAYRIGGEEFLLLLPGAHPEECVALAGRIRVAVEDAPLGDLTVTVSCGVAGSPAGSTFDYEVVFTACDKALYEAKARGRNQVSEAVGLRSTTLV